MNMIIKIGMIIMQKKTVKEIQDILRQLNIMEKNYILLINGVMQRMMV